MQCKECGLIINEDVVFESRCVNCRDGKISFDENVKRAAAEVAKWPDWKIKSMQSWLAPYKDD